MKRLFVFCDGTGQDGSIVPAPDGASLDSRASFLDGVTKVLEVNGNMLNPLYVTNVLRLSRAVKLRSSDGIQQLVLYQSGTGSEANFKGDTGAISDGLLQALGGAVASKIRDAYVFLAQNFEEGDEIFLFGFSRGAYTARKLAGLIDTIGLLTTEWLGVFFNIWSSLMKDQPCNIPPGTRRTNIRCVGVWDTVGSVIFGGMDALNISDTSLPECVDVGLHGLSIQENRERFGCTLWKPPAKGLRAGQILKQVWFPGAHADVGGAYERHELPDISLYWMAGEILELKLFDLDTDFLRRTEQPTPEAWGTTKGHNAFMETPLPLQAIMGYKTRIGGRSLGRDAVFHQSWKHAPEKTGLVEIDLLSLGQLITPKSLQRHFGLTWKPTYAPLNAFEKECLQAWGKAGTLGARVVMDDVTQVAGPGGAPTT